MTISSPRTELTRQRIEIDGHATALLEAGTGSPLLLLHGSGPGVSAESNWAPVIAGLAAQHRVIAFDFSGFGDSDPAVGGYDIKLWQRQLLGVLDALELERVTMIGNSFGGAMGLAAAMRHPDRVERLVLMGTPVGDYQLTDGLRAGREFDGSREGLRKVLHHFPHDPALITEELLDSRLPAASRPGALDALRALVPAAVDGAPTVVHGIPERHLVTVKAPTLILHGREDRVVPLALGLRLLAGIPDAELHVFGGCGHWVQLERAHDFVRMTLEFAGRAA